MNRRTLLKALGVSTLAVGLPSARDDMAADALLDRGQAAAVTVLNHFLGNLGNAARYALRQVTGTYAPAP